MSDVSPDLMDAVARIFAEGQQRRADRAMTAFRTLSPFERRIAKEAAVMGYVLGHRDGRLDAQKSQAEIRAEWPKDFTVLQNVLEHCDTTSDLYPFLGALTDGKRRRVTKLWPGETR